jgi:hypothetical protein
MDHAILHGKPFGIPLVIHPSKIINRSVIFTDITVWFRKCVSCNKVKGLNPVPGFVHVRKSQIQGLLKDIQGYVSANSRTKY